MLNLKRVKFTAWLGIVSIIGFVSILITSLTGFDFGAYADSLLFLIIGFALFLTGGAKFFYYFKNGLTASEINRIVTVAVGVASMVVGILIAPFIGIFAPVVDAVKIIIAVIAIIVISLEVYGDRK